MTEQEYIALLGAMVHDATLEHTITHRTSPVVFEREITHREMFVEVMMSDRDLLDWVQPCVTEKLFKDL